MVWDDYKLAGNSRTIIRVPAYLPVNLLMHTTGMRQLRFTLASVYVYIQAHTAMSRGIISIWWYPLERIVYYPIDDDLVKLMSHVCHSYFGDKADTEPGDLKCP